MATNNIALQNSEVVGDHASPPDPIGAALENRKQRRAAIAAKRARKSVLEKELADLEGRADETRKDLGVRIASGVDADVAELRAKLASLHVGIEGTTAAVEALAAQIRAEKGPLQSSEKHAVRVEIRQTFGQALAKAAETRVHVDQAGASHKSYVELVRKIVRLSRAIDEPPPLDLAGSRASLAGVGDGPDIWTVLRAHGIGRDWAAVPMGEQFEVLPCRTEDVLIDDDDDADELGCVTFAENVEAPPR